ncbi:MULTISPECIES: ABC transporter permease [Corynebacterium]|uniref:ABC transporter permease n=1 Tax=Corynebacterium TaxID=1716 RepID=UPI001EEC4E3A|nr:ABC transporter permease [Corynebacterium sp. BWA136]
MNYRSLASKIRKDTTVESVPFLSTCFILTFFIALLISTVGAKEVTESLSMGLMYSAVVSLVPFSLALKYCIRHVIMGRRAHYRALRLFGFPLSKIRYALVRETVVVIACFSLVNAFLVPMGIQPLFSLIYSGVSITLPSGFPSPFFVAFVTWLATSMLAIFPLWQETGSLAELREKRVDGSAGPSRPQASELFHYPLGIIACVIGITIFFLIPHAAPDSRWPLLFIYGIPFLVSAASVIIYALILYSIERISLRRRGWAPFVLAIRLLRSFIPTTVLRMACIFVLLPIILFITNDSALFSARQALADNVDNVFVAAPASEGTDGLAEVRKACREHSKDCLGVLNWVPAIEDAGQFKPSSLEEGAVYTLVEDRDGAIDSLVKNKDVVGQAPRSPFDQTWMRPWDQTFNSQSNPAWQSDEGGTYSVAIFSTPPDIGVTEGVSVVSAKQWAEKLPEQLLYGPNGTGTSEFIPLFTYVIVGVAVLIFGLALAQQGRLIRYARTIWEQGVPATEAYRMRKLANCVPSAFAVLLSLGSAWFLSTYMDSLIAHRLVVHFPSLPFGLILFLVVVIGLAAMGSNFVKSPKEDIR